MWANPLDNIKATQLAEAANGGINPYLPDGPDTPELTAPPGTLEHYQAALLADCNQLKQLKDISAKAAAKNTMLKQYMGFVNNYVNSGDCYPNSVAVQVAIWLFDVGDNEAAISLTLHLIKQAVHHTPFNFNRPLEVFICDCTYDWAAALLRKTPPAYAGAYLDAVVAEMEKGRWSLPVAVESKMYAILAKHKKLAGEYELALQLIEKAKAVNPVGHGTKRLQEETEAALKKAQG